MPKLREITAIQNQALKSGLFNGRRFQDGKWYDGIATKLNREESGPKEGDVYIAKFPAIIDNNGESKDVSYNDTYPIQFYHRLTAPLRYPDMSQESFGNPDMSNQEIADMVLICIAKRSKVKAFPEEICAAIVASFVKELSPAQLMPLQLQQATMEILETNTDTFSVFAQEFENVDFALTTDISMIAVRYRITTLYGKNCFTLCN